MVIALAYQDMCGLLITVDPVLMLFPDVKLVTTNQVARHAFLQTTQHQSIQVNVYVLHSTFYFYHIPIQTSIVLIGCLVVFCALVTALVKLVFLQITLFLLPLMIVNAVTLKIILG